MSDSGGRERPEESGAAGASDAAEGMDNPGFVAADNESNKPCSQDGPSGKDVVVDASSIDSWEEEEEEDADSIYGDAGNEGQHRLSLLMVCLAPATDLVAIWRYASIVYRNGGIILFPCLLLYFLIGFPLYYLELTVGQLQYGTPSFGQHVGGSVPLLRGVNYAATALLGITVIYYMTVITWTLLYFLSSLRMTLPWSECSYFYCPQDPSSTLCSEPNKTCNASITYNATGDETAFLSMPKIAATEEYFRNQVLWMSDSVSDVGVPSWRLVLCLLLSWAIIYMNVFKGKISLKKRVAIPAVALICLLGAMFSLATVEKGFQRGVRIYLSFDLRRLRSSQPWNDAAAQVVLSLGTGMGVVQILGRRSRIHHRLASDALAATVFQIFMGFFAGLVSFSCLGAVAESIGSRSIYFLKDGVSVCFVALSAIVAYAPALSATFFATLFLVSMCRLELMVATFALSVVRKAPWHRRWLQKHRSLAILALCIMFFAVGILLTTKAGVHLVYVIDHYVIASCGLILGLAECLATMHVYGTKRFSMDTENQLQFRMGRLWNVLWTLITPLTTLTVIILIWVGVYYPGDVSNKDRTSVLLGWLLFSLVIGAVPVKMLYLVITTWLSPNTTLESLLRPTMMTLQSPKEGTTVPFVEGKDKDHLIPIIMVKKMKPSMYYSRQGIPFGYMLPGGHEKLKPLPLRNIAADDSQTSVGNESEIQGSISDILRTASRQADETFSSFFRPKCFREHLTSTVMPSLQTNINLLRQNTPSRQRRLSRSMSELPNCTAHNTPKFVDKE